MDGESSLTPTTPTALLSNSKHGEESKDVRVRVAKYHLVLERSLFVSAYFVHEN